MRRHDGHGQQHGALTGVRLEEVLKAVCMGGVGVCVCVWRVSSTGRSREYDLRKSSKLGGGGPNTK